MLKWILNLGRSLIKKVAYSNVLTPLSPKPGGVAF